MASNNGLVEDGRYVVTWILDVWTMQYLEFWSYNDGALFWTLGFSLDIAFWRCVEVYMKFTEASMEVDD